MIKLQLLLGLVTLCLWVYSLVGVISTPEGSMRNLPKVAWLLLVLLFPFVGSIAWLVAGRPVGAPRRASANERPAPDYPEYDRPGRAAATDPERDADFLRQVRARAEEQRARHDAARREQQQREDDERERRRRARDGEPDEDTPRPA